MPQSHLPRRPYGLKFLRPITGIHTAAAAFPRSPTVAVTNATVAARRILILLEIENLRLR